MTQEVQVTIKLEVDASKDKAFIESFMYDMEDTYTRTVSRRNRMEVVGFKVLHIKEESEIYGTENYDDCARCNPDEIRKDAMFLQEIYNSLYAHRLVSPMNGGEYGKYDSLIKDWLKELRKQAGLESDADMKAAFIEEVGDHLWEEPDFWDNETETETIDKP